jgi:hypothetical protein
MKVGDRVIYLRKLGPRAEGVIIDLHNDTGGMLVKFPDKEVLFGIRDLEILIDQGHYKLLETPIPFEVGDRIVGHSERAVLVEHIDEERDLVCLRTAEGNMVKLTLNQVLLWFMFGEWSIENFDLEEQLNTEE